jgi:regulator of replication initiation timing
MIHLENILRDLMTLQDQYESQITELKAEITELETRLEESLETNEELTFRHSTLYYTVSTRCPKILL